MKNKTINICHEINPFLGLIAMFITQDIVMKIFFKKKKIINNKFLIPHNSSVILAPTHRSRWDGLILTMARVGESPKRIVDLWSQNLR